MLAVATVRELGMIEIWVAFGKGKELRYVPAHEISASLGPRKSLALPVFHAFTGCDAVSHFAHVGKKTAWKVWDTHDAVTAAFCELRGAPKEVADEVYSALGRFTILMYDRTSRSESVNETRELLFTRKGRPMAALPPSEAALQQHIRRTALQGGHDWGAATQPCRHLPSGDWGWTHPDKWQPLWTNIPEASVSCQELLHCRCRTRCTDCKCVQAHLKCTVYCTCKADCANG